MNIWVPDSFRAVDKAVFDQFLKECGRDYVRDAWSNGIEYRWRDNQQRWAVDLEKGMVMVDPKLLVPQRSGVGLGR